MTKSTTNMDLETILAKSVQVDDLLVFIAKVLMDTFFSLAISPQ